MGQHDEVEVIDYQGVHTYAESFHPRYMKDEDLEYEAPAPESEGRYSYTVIERGQFLLKAGMTPNHKIGEQRYGEMIIVQPRMRCWGKGL